MRRIMIIMLAMLACVSLFSGCDNSPPDNGNSQSTDNTSDTAVPDSIRVNENGLRIYDCYHPDDRERSMFFSVSVPELDNALIECRREDCIVYLNGERLIGATSDACVGFYLSDLTGDGAPELCFCMAFGNGIIHYRVEVFDAATKQRLFVLSDRMNYDYYLFLRNGVLCIKETEYAKDEASRTGVLTYDGAEVTVAWDSEVNESFD